MPIPNDWPDDDGSMSARVNAEAAKRGMSRPVLDGTSEPAPTRKAGIAPLEWLSALAAAGGGNPPNNPPGGGGFQWKSLVRPMTGRAALIPAGAMGLASLVSVADQIANRDPGESAMTTGARAIGGGVGAALPFVVGAPFGPAGLAAATLISPLTSGALAGLGGLLTGAVEPTAEEKQRRNYIADATAQALAKQKQLEILAPTEQKLARKAIENELMRTQLLNAAAIERERWSALNQGLANQSARIDAGTNAAVQALYTNGIM